jgi:ABC-2 type transport system ATP-binding protein
MPSRSSHAAIEVSDLVIEYPPTVVGATPTRAVNGLSFTAAPGSIVALLGPNGAGKTSTVECLEGHRRPTSGTVRVLGLDPRTQMPALAPKLGVMLQRNGVYLTMNPRQVLNLFASYYGERARNAADVLTEVGLDNVASIPWRRLSGGEQQRLSLGMALVGQPEVVFLDEPTAGMDTSARQLLWGVIRKLKDTGATVLLTTHYLEEAERLADRVVIIDRGQVVANDTPDGLRNTDTSDMRFGATAGLDVRALSNHLGGTVTESTAGEYHADVSPTPQNVAALTNWLAERNVSLGDLRAGRQRLEDVFLQLTASEDASTTSPRSSRSRRSRS